jgi:hypothetical protein
MIASRLGGGGGPLEIPFDNYQTVSGGFGPVTSTTRWSTSTDNISDIIATVKPTNYDDNTENSTTLLGNYFTRGGGATGALISTSQFSINGIRYPNIPCDNTQGDVFMDTLHSLALSHDTLGSTDPNMDSLPKWSSNYFTHMHTFSYPDTDDAHRLVGLSGRGNQILGTFELTGSGSNVLPLIWLKSKSVLRIAQSKLIEVVL